jgi:ATP-dependent helicase/nuclease subunit A
VSTVTTPASRRAGGLTIVGASAGSGKTHRLTQEVLGALTRGACPIEGLVAVTYTRRAQVELASRIRRTLLASDDPGRAARLPLANVGTVHAACLRLVRELALDAGLSPSVDVLPDADRLLRTVLEDVLDLGMQSELLRLASRMAILKDPQKDRVDWITPVVDVITLARHGRVPSSALPAMAERSTASLLALLPPPTTEDLDRSLADAISRSRVAIDASGCGTDGTAKVRRILDIAARDLRQRELDWPSWCRLGKLAPGKKARAAVEPAVSVAQRVLEHPGLRADLARFTQLVFAAAERTMDAYARAKAERKAVDYVDMIDAALTVLAEPAVAADLRERLRLVVVDELQDSSPIQLALFLRLHELAGGSRWVGDPKQCIFEYAGADPALMDATVRWVEKCGGRTDRLTDNWRTRRDLVDVCSALFETAFAAHGVAAEDVRVKARRDVPEKLAKLPPLGVWSLETKNKGDDAVAIAEGVRRMLAQPHRTPVVDRATGKARSVRAGDIAILVATNTEAETIAGALAAHRIGVAVARAGLIGTPEGVALQAALALVVDPAAGREAAILEALQGFEGTTPDEWLSAKIHAAGARKAAGDAGVPMPEEQVSAWMKRLARVRDRRDLLSPSEMVDAVLGALDLAALCARWPDATQRLANIDALRALTGEYESRCLELAEAATLSGLLRFFGELGTPVFLRGEELAADAQAEARGEHAVTVLTYHRSKGLEWPVVVLASLDREGRRKAFDVVPETDADTLNPDAPLEGRWIRYWPWPFSPSAKHDLEDRAAVSAEGTRVAVRENRERARLLYVGFTRARDHLVLALRPGRTRWLDELRAGSGQPALAVDADRKTVSILRRSGREMEVPVRWHDLGCDEPGEPKLQEPTWFDRVERAPLAEATYRVLPSEAGGSGLALPALQVGTITRLHPPLLLAALPETAWADVGSAIHAFLAADLPDLDAAERRARAARLLAPVGLGGDDDVQRVIASADALRVWVEATYPGAVWRREAPVRAKVDAVNGEREIVGTIDLLLDLPAGGCVIVDHKSDRVTEEAAWRARAAVHAPQLAAYALAAELAGRKIVAHFVHFAVGGGIVELSPSGQVLATAMR